MHLTLLTWQGLGDTLVSLPVAYHFEALGYTVHLVNTIGGIVQRRQFVNDLPTYPRLEPDVVGDVFDLTQCPRFDWHTGNGLMQSIVDGSGISLQGTPCAPWLQITEAMRERAAELAGASPYVLLAPQGSSPHRQLTQEQVAAVSKAARTVLVHTDHWPTHAGCHNLSGLTSMADLFALTACASAVVSVDTGALHLAAAFGTPVLGVTAQRTINAYGLCREYRPSLFAVAEEDARTVPVELIVQLLEDMLVTAPSDTQTVPDSGPRWWERSEVRTRQDRAQRHQEAIDRCRTSAGYATTTSPMSCTGASTKS